MDYVLLILVGLLPGIIGALIGLGGGVILVPALLAFFPELSPQRVVGLSVITMIFTGLSSVLSYLKVGTVDYRSGFIFFVGSAPGIVIGALVNKRMELPAFNLYLGILLIALFALLLLRGRLKPVEWFVKHGRKQEFTDPQGKTYTYGYPVWFALILTFGIGFASGLFGIGGGSILVPAVILLFLFPPHVAIGTSMLMVFLSAIVNSIAHISLGNVPWLYAAAVIPGAYAGAKIGAALNKRLNSEVLVTVLRFVLLILGIRSIFEGIW